jgi:site-specific DNA-methyltransferase (adenine-specific)
MRSMPEASVDAIVTDPPYGTNYKSSKQNHDTRSGGKTRHVERPEFFQAIVGDASLPIAWLPEAFRVLKPGSALYAFCHWSKWAELSPAVEGAGFRVKNMLVLRKSNHGMGDLSGAYAPTHELLMFATKGRHVLNFENGRTRDVLDVPVNPSFRRRSHPNEKPASWMLEAIRNSTAPGDLVLDPFCGSGSTGVACAILGRRFLGVEIAPEFVAVAREKIAADALAASPSLFYDV